MPENPYESPKGEPEPWRRSITMVALTVLSVPAAAIAGGGTCLGSATLIGVGGVAAGIAVMIAVLIAANHGLGRSSAGRVRYNAVFGLILATPPALIVPFLLALHGYDLDNAGGHGAPYFLAAAFTVFFLWSLGFWIGLRWSDD